MQAQGPLMAPLLAVSYKLREGAEKLLTSSLLQEAYSLLYFSNPISLFRI